jgi:hypothetical protein
MSNEYKFRKVYPADAVQWYNGEQPTPAKFTGIFQYVNAAFFSIESFIGNGLDYDKPGEDMDRYSQVNLSTAMGHMSKVYSSLNKLAPLHAIAYKFAITDQLDVADKVYFDGGTQEAPGSQGVKILSNFSIPIGQSFQEDIYICMNFKSKGAGVPIVAAWFDTLGAQQLMDMSAPAVVKATLNNNLSKQTDHVLKYTSMKIVAGTYIEALHFDINTADEFWIFSLSMIADKEGLKVITDYKSSDSTSHVMPLNEMYSMGIDSKSIDGVNNQSYAYQLRCVYAGVCDKAISINCIGNTYDFYVNDGYSIKYKTGKPKCAGKTYNNYGANSVDASILPQTNPEIPLKKYEYTPNAVETPNMVIFQSPMYCQDRVDLLKYHPIFISSEIDGMAIGNGLNAVYDVQSTASPLVETSMLFSCDRADMARMANNDNDIMLDTIDRYYIIGGKFGVADMINKSVNNDHASNRTIAVYAE